MPAWYIVREVRVRKTEIEREREGGGGGDRRQWRHHVRAEFGIEFTFSPAQNSHSSFCNSHISHMVTIVALN